MNGVFYRAVMVLLSLALCVFVVTWFKTRQELRAVTAANETLRKSLGDMTIAIVEKDRVIARWEQSSCGAEEKSQAGSGSAPRRADRP
jgi:hypothetical protein